MFKDVFLNTCANRTVPICLFLKGNDVCKATVLRMPCDFVFLLLLTASLASVSVSFVIVRLNVSLVVLGKYLYCSIDKTVSKKILTNSALKYVQDRGF